MDRELLGKLLLKINKRDPNEEIGLEEIKAFFNQGEKVAVKFHIFLTQNNKAKITALDFFNLIQAIMTNHQKLKTIFFKMDSLSSFECLYKIFMEISE